MAIVEGQAFFTDASMVIALWLLSEAAVVDRQATFTDTSTRISSMVMALCLQFAAVMD